jgi:hypothetical protein
LTGRREREIIRIRGRERERERGKGGGGEREKERKREREREREREMDDNLAILQISPYLCSTYLANSEKVIESPIPPHAMNIITSLSSWTLIAMIIV